MSVDSFKTLGFYVTLRRVEPKIKKTAGGLELTDTHREDVRYIRGEVISAGPLAEGIKCCDIVLYDKHAGNSLESEDELLKCVTIKDIVIVYDGEV